MNNILIISNKLHPFYEKLKEKASHFLDYDSGIDINNAIGVDAILDITSLPKKDKQKLVADLSVYNLPIASDLSCYEFLDFYGVSAALSLGFHSPKNTYEISFIDNELIKTMNEFKTVMNIEFKEVKSLKSRFSFPRIISMIINEAFIALEEDLASQDDIDTAMKYGVNYPLGPLEWASKIGKHQILYLLQDLWEKTQDERYIPSPSLKST